MTNLMEQGLLITAIGMGLVFVVIIFLWGLMALLMRLTSREKDEGNVVEQPPELAASEIPQTQMVEDKRQVLAAAVAVAHALAEAKGRFSKVSNRNATGEMNPWQTVHRSRQIENRR
jgi:sodium pump decarboxylase gamma subunit